MENHISIPLYHISEDLELKIFPEGNSRVFKIEDAEAEKYGEVPFQILESQSYEYSFSKKGYRLACDYGNIVIQSHREKFSGKINPSYFVGTLRLNVSHKEKSLKDEHVYLEVLATKFNSDDLDKSYRVNYRFMLESITEKCTELLFQVNAPIQQHFETDFSKKNESLYQQFSFVNSIIGSNEFHEAIQQIISNPKTNWTNNEELADIRSVRKFTRTSLKQIVNRGNRMPVSANHPLYKNGIKNIPTHITNNKKIEVVDNAENRFIKHALQTYLHFSESCLSIFAAQTRAHKEAKHLASTLEQQLNNSFFKHISRPTNLNFNSPVLQRKSGYREVLKSWLKFDLAAKLTWAGGEDVYHAGKRDISKLYEYWVFFMLYDLFRSKFNLEHIEHEGDPFKSLIGISNNKINFIIKSGKHTALSGISEFENRKLNVKFSYNQTFKGDRLYGEKSQGSYTKSMYPDYTLTFWPVGIDEVTAEMEELIVHVHFDAKYKVSYTGKFEETKEDEEDSERRGVYKNVDLFKMHAYKDAIRRTGGAYILYPGNNEPDIRRGFHEIIPGLGAFALRPDPLNNGSQSLSVFIDKIIKHFLNRASQRERIAYRTYDIFKEKPSQDDTISESLPEAYGDNRGLLPHETYIIVGYCKSKNHFDWYLKNGLYNFRMNDDHGSLFLDNKTVNAKYLLLDQTGKAPKLFKINSKGPRVYGREKLSSMGYPSDSIKEQYLIIEIEETQEINLKSVNMNRLEEYKKEILKINNPRTLRGTPISLSLSELLSFK